MTTVQQIATILFSILVVSQCLPPPPSPPAGQPSFRFSQGLDSLCRVMCARKDAACPAECFLGNLDLLNKRSMRVSRGPRFGDFRVNTDSNVNRYFN